jgi:hypothetical protein
MRIDGVAPSRPRMHEQADAGAITSALKPSAGPASCAAPSHYADAAARLRLNAPLRLHDAAMLLPRVVIMARVYLGTTYAPPASAPASSFAAMLLPTAWSRRFRVALTRGLDCCRYRCPRGSQLAGGARLTLLALAVASRRRWSVAEAKVAGALGQLGQLGQAFSYPPPESRQTQGQVGQLGQAFYIVSGKRRACCLSLMAIFQRAYRKRLPYLPQLPQAISRENTKLLPLLP